jgi:hypothetical protein
MTGQLSTIICVIFGVVSWYYFNKFMESEREYSRLHKSYDELHIENKKMKSRVKDLQSYKNDVSKTFKILDNELVLINDHLKRNSQQNIQAQTNFPMNSSITSSIPIGRIPLARVASFTSLPQNNNISLLTPELLTSLFNMNTEEINHQQQPVQQQPVQQQPVQQQPVQQQPVQQQPVQQQPVQQQPVQYEPVQQQHVQYEPVQQQHVQYESVQDQYDQVQDQHVQYDQVQDQLEHRFLSCNEYDQYLINNN